MKKYIIAACLTAYLTTHCIASSEHEKSSSSHENNIVELCMENAFKAIKNDDLHTFATLLKASPNLLYAKYRGQATLLTAAAYYGACTIVEFLLVVIHDRYANAPHIAQMIVNMQDGKGVSALALATIKGHKKIIELLLNRRAYIDCLDRIMRRTPLHWACYYGHMEIIRLLTRKNANAQVRDKNMHTPLQLAQSRLSSYQLVHVHSALTPCAPILNLLTDRAD